jgi:hypothetical protein
MPILQRSRTAIPLGVSLHAPPANQSVNFSASRDNAWDICAYQPLQCRSRTREAVFGRAKGRKSAHCRCDWRYGQFLVQRSRSRYPADHCTDYGWTGWIPSPDHFCLEVLPQLIAAGFTIPNEVTNDCDPGDKQYIGNATALQSTCCIWTNIPVANGYNLHSGHIRLRWPGLCH